MIVAFFMTVVIAFISFRRRNIGRLSWVLLAVFALLFSLFLAYESVSTVWVPHPLSDNVFSQQNPAGWYSGLFPWSKLSYPFYLNVHHSSFSEIVFGDRYGNGNASFIVLADGAKFLETNATFQYYYQVQGQMPLYYRFSSFYADSLDFYLVIIALFTTFNIIAATTGIALVYALNKAFLRLRATHTASSHGTEPVPATLTMAFQPNSPAS